MKSNYITFLLIGIVFCCKSQTINYLSESQFSNNIKINNLSLNEIDNPQPQKSTVESYFGCDLEEKLTTSPNLSKEYWNDQFGIYLRYEDNSDTGNEYKLINLKISGNNFPLEINSTTYFIGDDINFLNNYSVNFASKSYLFSIQETSAIVEIYFYELNNKTWLFEYNLYN